MYNFSIKEIHNDEERKLNNMFDGYDSCENDIVFNKYKKGIFRREIRYKEWTEEYYTKKLKKLLRYYFDPLRKMPWRTYEKLRKKWVTSTEEI